METILNFAMNALVPLEIICTRLFALLPGVVSAAVLLLVGLWACHWSRIVIEYVCRMLQVDDMSRRVGLATLLYRLGLGPSLGHVLTVGIGSVIMIGTVLAAADSVGFPAVSDFIRYLVGLAPRIFSSVFILAGGLFVGDILGRIVHRAADANHVRGSEALMRVTHGLLVFFSALMALERLGLDLTIFTSSMNIIVASIGLGVAIAVGVAFGMAGRDTAEKWIRDLTPRGKPSNGHEVKMRVMR